MGPFENSFQPRDLPGTASEALQNSCKKTFLEMTSRRSNANHSPGVGSGVQGPLPQVGLVPIKMHIAAELAEQWASNKKCTVFPTGSSKANYNIQKHEVVFQVISPYNTALVPKVISNAAGYDGPGSVSFSDLKQDMLTKLPGEENEPIVERWLAEVASATVCVLGVATQDAYVIDGDNNFNNSNHATSIAMGGLDSIYADSDFTMPRQLLRARFGTKEEMLSRYSHQRNQSSNSGDRLTMWVEAIDAQTFTQRQNAMLVAYRADPLRHHSLVYETANQVIASELIAQNMMINADLIKGIRFAGALMDAGILVLNPLHSSAEIRDMLDGNTGGAVADINRLQLGRSTVADFHVHPLLLLAPYYCVQGTKRLVTPPASELIGFEQHQRVALPLGAQPCIGAYGSNLFEEITGALLTTYRPTDPMMDDSLMGGTVSEFFRQGKEAVLAGAALKTFCTGRMYIENASTNINSTTRWPGAIRNSINQVSQSNYVRSNDGTLTSVGDYVPNPNTQGGRWTTAVQENQFADKIAFESGHLAMTRSALGMVVSGGRRGHWTHFVHAPAAVN